ncbi:hypothetical protein JTB14_034619 [Gonioctena quinquepunctata]|nr:hypothetical protein JTB14_034619 [Gonioctena quinquepunctata]
MQKILCLCGNAPNYNIREDTPEKPQDCASPYLTQVHCLYSSKEFCQLENCIRHSDPVLNADIEKTINSEKYFTKHTSYDEMFQNLKETKKLDMSSRFFQQVVAPHTYGATSGEHITEINLESYDPQRTMDVDPKRIEYTSIIIKETDILQKQKEQLNETPKIYEENPETHRVWESEYMQAKKKLDEPPLDSLNNVINEVAAIQEANLSDDLAEDAVNKTKDDQPELMETEQITHVAMVHQQNTDQITEHEVKS